jgi:hypothetical protein
MNKLFIFFFLISKPRMDLEKEKVTLYIMLKFILYEK